MIVNICGIPHEVIEKEDCFTNNEHFGCIDYDLAVITVNKGLNDQIKTETIMHEMVHGMLLHLGYDELRMDEKLVQALANAIYQGFEIKAESEET